MIIPAYIHLRLESLSQLKHGWYGNEGIAGEPISPETIQRARQRFASYKGPHVYLYPTVDGFISAEWSNEDYEDEVIQ
jgi:hypothetical protein